MRIRRMTFEEARDYQPTEKELKRARTFRNVDFSDCPKLTRADLEKLQRVGSVYKVVSVSEDG